MSTNEEKIQESLAKIKAKKNEALVLSEANFSGIGNQLDLSKNANFENNGKIELKGELPVPEGRKCNEKDLKENKYMLKIGNITDVNDKGDNWGFVTGSGREILISKEERYDNYRPKVGDNFLVRYTDEGEVFSFFNREESFPEMMPVSGCYKGGYLVEDGKITKRVEEYEFIKKLAKEGDRITYKSIGEKLNGRRIFMLFSTKDSEVRKNLRVFSEKTNEEIPVAFVEDGYRDVKRGINTSYTSDEIQKLWKKDISMLKNSILSGTYCTNKMKDYISSM